MTGEPVDDAVRELLATYALDAVDADERAAVEAALAREPELRAELDRHREALAALIPSAPASDELWQRIARELDEPGVAAQADEPPGQVIPFRRRRAWLGVAGTAAAVAAAVALTLVVTNGDGDGGGSKLGDPFASAPIQALGDADVAGEARLYGPDQPGGVLVVDLDRVPPSPSGHHYQVWVLREGGGGAMEAVGSFSPGSGATHLELPLPGPGDYAAFDISIQEDGGSPEHSGTSLAGASFS